MARTDDDSWDLASSVGATATMVAAARAVATRADQPVIQDQFAEPLVRAVGIDFLSRLASGDITPADLATEDSPVGMSRFADGMAARTRFFDDFFTAATAAGVRQAVILASGLDARSYRLDWPLGTVVYEIDQPEVIAFKTRTLAELGANPTVDMRTVAVDLRVDWPAALTAAGFDPTQPTAWIAEGLFGYLPPEAQDALLDRISELSAPGSRLAAGGSPPHDNDVDADEVREKMRTAADQWREYGFDIDFAELVYVGERSDIVEYLRNHGWSADSRTANDLLTEYGMEALTTDEPFAEVIYLTAVR